MQTQTSNNYLLPNPLGVPQLPAINTYTSLGLNQVEGFVPAQEFVDETNTRWKLVKSAANSTIDIPDPKSMQVLDYWNHEFPGIKSKLYVYVVEGVRQPRVETEQPTKILYQWFSTVFVPTFTPQMITDREWLKANVYAAPVINARVSKLNAICHIATQSQSASQQPDENRLLQIEELNGHNQGSAKPSQGRNTTTGAAVSVSQTGGDAHVSDQHA